MDALISLARARLHLRSVVDDEEDADIQLKIDMASSIVMDYLKLTDIPDSWRGDFISGSGGSEGSPPPANIPRVVQAAVLLVLGELYANREAGDANVLSDAVKSLLHRFRDPALA